MPSLALSAYCSEYLGESFLNFFSRNAYKLCSLATYESILSL